MRWYLYLFIALPFLPAFNIARDIDIASVRVLIPILALSIGAAAGIKRRFSFPFTLPVLSILFFFSLTFVSVIWSVEPAFAIRKALFFATVAPALYLATCVSDRGRVLVFYLFGAVLSAVSGLLVFLAQFFIGRDGIASGIARYVGPTLWGEAVADAVARFPSLFVDIGNGRTLLRTFFPFPDPHTAALFWGMALVIVAGMIIDVRFFAKRIILAGAALVLLAALLGTFSRGAYLALAGSIFVIGILSFAALLEKRDPARQKKRVAFFLACVLVGGVFLALTGGPVAERFITSFDPAEGSNAARLSLWKDAIETFAQRPFFGVGLGGFAVEQDALAGYRSPINAHSTYLEIAAELGIFGLLFFVTALASGVFFAQRFAARGSLFHAGVFAALLFYSFHALFEIDLYAPANMIILLTLLSWTGREEEHQVKTF